MLHAMSAHPHHHQDRVSSPTIRVDPVTGIDVGRWTMDPDILALLGRRIAELNDFADRIADAQSRLRAHLIARGGELGAHVARLEEALA